ncbi:MAG TPA: tRNA uridine-5-carboxymethylaminomethyl(34) synthesis GTPase MnmE [Burkholderiales bacterium]|nr:tRNA uridine-5-carboxymethylaminomethyl(34) synthesis GTPase MnmE [Burkholderiales bacterium]
MTGFSENTDTIAAIATALGRGGIGVVRVSGKNLAPLMTNICGLVPEPRIAKFTTFRDSNGRPLDQGLLLYFPAPNSFTGEDVVEFHGHGGNAVLQLVLRRCLEMGARLAEPGEFTKRAFLNNKMDLAQAESVADLIDASSGEAARSAMRSLSGEFSKEIHKLVDALIRLRMLVEATLDFPEEDTDFSELIDADNRLKSIEDHLDGVLKKSQSGAALREGLRAVLIGQPNVGKSSLINRLAGEEVSIVTSVPGTTRDSVRSLIHIEGVPIHIIDTAGLRETEDVVEKIGIERTWSVVQDAGLALLIVDATRGVAQSDCRILEKLPDGLQVVTVLNKVDLVDEEHFPVTDLRVSAKTGKGIDDLRRKLLEAAGLSVQGEGVFMARERHIRALRFAQGHIGAARGHMMALEIFAEELRLAQGALSSITGEFTADDLLGEIFSRFCIGK